MNLPRSIRIIETTKLFNKKYKYKIVVKTPVAHWFRHNNLENVKKKLNSLPSRYEERLREVSEQKYVSNLLNSLEVINDYDLRVEHPYISIYSNSKDDIIKLAKINAQNVKYVSLPGKNPELLEPNQIILKRLDYKFRVTLKYTQQEFNSFLSWAENNDKVRLTKRAKRDLSSNMSFGGGYFYVKDEKTLSMVRLFMGSYIRSIENIVKS